MQQSIVTILLFLFSSSMALECVPQCIIFLSERGAAPQIGSTIISRKLIWRVLQ